MTTNPHEFIQAAYRLEEIDLVDLTREQLEQLKSVPSVIDALYAFEVTRRARSTGNGG